MSIVIIGLCIYFMSQLRRSKIKYLSEQLFVSNPKQFSLEMSARRERFHWAQFMSPRLSAGPDVAVPATPGKSYYLVSPDVYSN